MSRPLRLAAAFVLVAAASAAQPGAPSAVRLLDVPFIQQSEALCGGAAAAMVMRFWGATGVYAETFAPLVDRAAGGIRGDTLAADLRGRGWTATTFGGEHAVVAARLAARQPVIALIEDRPNAFHFVVIVAWTGGRVVYHDPARAPFRVVAERSFDDAWAKSGRWTLLLLPPATGVAAALGTPSAGPAAASPCDALVERGVAAAADGRRAEALETLRAAAGLCPDSSAPLREAAGVEALAENWSAAEHLARGAVARDAGDAHAWRTLATAAYVRGDDAAALAAWNAAGEPRLDLVQIHGLGRTRHAVVASLIGLEPQELLTPAGLAAAGHRLRELPAAEVARVAYTPRGGGLATVDAVIVERPAWPTGRGAVVASAARLATDRELRASVAGLSGGGERLDLSWRFWANRPRLEATLAAPSSVGLWTVQLFGEEQTYQAGAAEVERRRGGSLSLANWTSTLTRWEAAAGVDVWSGRGRTFSAGIAVDQRFAADRWSVQASATGHAGAVGAWVASAGVHWRSRARHEGTVVSAGAGVIGASAHAPRALWPGADTGHARQVRLRAHPLLDDGRITGEVFGRRLYHAGGEARRWLKPVRGIVRLAPAAFIDAARAAERMEAGDAWHADAGVGLRLALPGAGMLRIDVARGLRDGATRLSAGWMRAFE